MAPNALLEAFRALAAAHPDQLHRQVLGHDATGHPIEAYRWGSGPVPVLLYGFPDPGEAVGGTVLLQLAQAWLEGAPGARDWPCTWHAIPCLNHQDQPEGGHRLAPVRKRADQEVDWCLKSPRPETQALLRAFEGSRALVVFPLHDEFHAHEPLAWYGLSSLPLEGKLVRKLRGLWESHGLRVAFEPSDPSMGEGFALMSIAPDWENSSFYAMSQAGAWVFIAEPSLWPALDEAALVALHLATLLLCLEAFVKGDALALAP